MAEELQPSSVGSPPTGDVRPARQTWVAWSPILLPWLAVLVVISLARRPPILDLPHQLDQGTLLERVQSGEATHVKVNWLGPNKLGLLVVIAVSRLTGPALAPRAAAAAIASLWFVAILAIGVIRRRDPWSVALASASILASPFYAGFFNFLSGISALAFWSWEIGRNPRDRSLLSLAVSTLVGTLLFYLAHAFWLAVGGALVASYVLLLRFTWREVFARAVGSLPVAIGALLWQGTLTESGWQSTIRMLVSPIDRLLDFRVFANLMLGGLRGPTERIFVALVLVWLLVALVFWVRSRCGSFDRFLLMASAFFLAIALLAPDKLDRTILLAWRWGPFALTFAILAFPAPFRGLPARAALASFAILGLVAPTALAWRGFEREEMAGFEEALAAVPERSTIAGLDFMRKSPRFPVDPYFQMFAYASYEREVRINFSFAELASSLVVVKDFDSPVPWTRGLEWRPHYLVPSDLQYFDYLLVHATPEKTATLTERLAVASVAAGSHNWALLRIDRSRAAAILEGLKESASRSAVHGSASPGDP